MHISLVSRRANKSSLTAVIRPKYRLREIYMEILNFLCYHHFATCSCMKVTHLLSFLWLLSLFLQRDSHFLCLLPPGWPHAETQPKSLLFKKNPPNLIKLWRTQYAPEENRDQTRSPSTAFFKVTDANRSKGSQEES